MYNGVFIQLHLVAELASVEVWDHAIMMAFEVQTSQVRPNIRAGVDRIRVWDSNGHFSELTQRIVVIFGAPTSCALDVPHGWRQTT